MGKDMTKMLNTEPMIDYKLQAEFQRRLRKQPLKIRQALRAMLSCCMKMIPSSNGVVSIVATKRVGHNESIAGVRTGFHGTCKCRNLWACPVCAATFLTEKCKKLTAWLESINSDYAAFMVTFTIPHTRRHRAADVIEEFKQVRRYAFHGTAERYLKNTLKSLGTVTTSEVTVSAYGFHYHQHVLYVVPKSNWQHVEEFCRRVSANWNGALIRVFDGFDPATAQTPAVWVSRNKAGEVLQVTDARYLYGYGVELTKSRRGNRHKKVRGTRTLFDLITGSDEDFDTLCEWLLASRNLHRITLSRGLRVMLDKAFDEKKTTCDDIETSVVASWCAQDWHEVTEAEVVTGLPIRYGALKAAADGYDSLVKFCARHCIPIPALSTQVFFQMTGTELADEDLALLRIRLRKLRDLAAKDDCIHDEIMKFAAAREARISEVRKNYSYGRIVIERWISESAG